MYAFWEHEIKHGVAVIRNFNSEEESKTRQEMLDEVFPQTFEACSPGWGDGCQFKKLCFGNIGSPVEAGFEAHRSHHDIEEAALLEAEKS